MLSGALRRGQGGIGTGEKSVQAHGLVLPTSPNSLDQHVLKLRVDGLLSSKYSLTSLRGWSHIFLSHWVVSLAQVTPKHQQT